jgi:hypothetical protein
MIRKTLFAVTLIALAALAASGLRLNQPAGSTAEAAAITNAAQSCNAAIQITDFNVISRAPGGGTNVAVNWNAPQLPACTSVSQYRVKVTLKFPKVTREHEEVVPGNKLSAQFLVRGFITDTTPQSFTVTVNADLKTVATASGSKSGPITIVP